MKDRKQIEHPSYGQIQVSRVHSSSGQTMYGSKLKHINYIVLTVSRSALIRDLSQEWYHPTEEIIEVRMSENQFAQMITSLNRGTGSPCTIQRVQGKRIEDPKHTIETETIRKEFKQATEHVTAQLREALQKLEEMISPGAKVNKSAVASLKESIAAAVSGVDSSMPFIIGQFEEAIDDTIASAKNDIEAYATHMMIGLTNNNQVVTMLERSSDNNQ